MQSAYNITQNEHIDNLASGDPVSALCCQAANVLQKLLD